MLRYASEKIESPSPHGNVLSTAYPYRTPLKDFLVTLPSSKATLNLKLPSPRSNLPNPLTALPTRSFVLPSLPRSITPLLVVRYYSLRHHYLTI